MADQAFALLLALTRGIRDRRAGHGAWFKPRQPDGAARQDDAPRRPGRRRHADRPPGPRLRHARAGHRSQGHGTARLSSSASTSRSKLIDLLPRADVVVLACPLTAETRGLIGRQAVRGDEEVGRTSSTSAGGPESRPKPARGAGEEADRRRRPRRDRPRTVAGGPSALEADQRRHLPAHRAASRRRARDRQWRLFRENVRRFVAGEPLLCVVDKAKGY